MIQVIKREERGEKFWNLETKINPTPNRYSRARARTHARTRTHTQLFDEWFIIYIKAHAISIYSYKSSDALILTLRDLMYVSHEAWSWKRRRIWLRRPQTTTLYIDGYDNALTFPADGGGKSHSNTTCQRGPGVLLTVSMMVYQYGTWILICFTLALWGILGPFHIDLLPSGIAWTNDLCRSAKLSLDSPWKLLQRQCLSSMWLF